MSAVTGQDKHHPTLLLHPQVSASDQHGDFTIQGREPVSTLDASHARSLIMLQAFI